MLFTSCSKDNEDKNTLVKQLKEELIFNKTKEFKVTNHFGNKIRYKSKIGKDFKTAYDSVLKMSTFFLPKEEDYMIVEKKLAIDFKYDNRDFFCIYPGQSKGSKYEGEVLNASPYHVIDTKGNYYILLWPECGNPHGKPLDELK